MKSDSSDVVYCKSQIVAGESDVIIGVRAPFNLGGRKVLPEFSFFPVAWISFLDFSGAKIAPPPVL